MLTIHEKNPPLYLYTTVKIPPSPLPKLPLKPPQSTFFKLKPLVVTSPSFFFFKSAEFASVVRCSCSECYGCFLFGAGAW